MTNKFTGHVIPRLILLAGVLLSIYPAMSSAGTGYYLDLTNNMTPSVSEPGYPQFTVHVDGGSDCWYDYGLDDWNQFAPPGGTASLYTEKEQSAWICSGQGGTRGAGLFVRTSASAPWQRIFEFTFKSARVGYEIYVYPPFPSNICGLVIDSPFTKPVNAGGTSARSTSISVSGTLDLSKCPTTSTAPLGAPQAAVIGDEITVNATVGTHRLLNLAGLDPESEWELNACTGQSIANPKVTVHRFAGKVPKATKQLLYFDVVASGRTECSLTAYHYPERAYVDSFRLIVNAH